MKHSYHNYLNGDIEGEREEIQVVCFMLDNFEYGYPILQVKEIVKLEHVIQIPKMANFLEGVMDLRGSIVPLIDLRKNFNLRADPHENLKVLILKITSEDFLGAIVDDISEIITISLDSIMPLSSNMIKEQAKRLSGVIKLPEDRSIILLDVSTMLTEIEIKEIKAGGGYSSHDLKTGTPARPSEA